ncbi:MAG: adenosylcobinamide-GDP ribazoletransferase, partial [Paracoccaceae bacterium]
MRKNDMAVISALDIAVALVLLTRLPLPALPDHAFRRQAYASWAFPLVGALVAMIAGGIGWGAFRLGLPLAAAAGILLGVQIILTGAMHEDGLADSVDGLWGGFSRERRLEIMKDSAIGTYGVLALILSVGLRWVALTALIPLGIGAVLAAAILSRAVLPFIMT